MTSQNGWDIVGVGQLDKSPISGTNIIPVPGVLRGDVATILHWVGEQFNKRVETLYNPGCWGWNASTPIPGTSIYSNHSSGTAVDFNAPSFPWKTRTMTPAQRQACRDIVAQTGGVVVWGGDFPTFVDEMHFEIDATDAELANAVKKIKGGMFVTDKNLLFNYFRIVLGRAPTDKENKTYIGMPADVVFQTIIDSQEYANLLVRQNSKQEYTPVAETLYRKKG